MKKFLIIGNMNATTYKEIFPMIVESRLWLGAMGIGDMHFTVPHDYGMRETRSWRDEDGVNWRSLGNVCWYTNLEHAKHHEPLELSRSYVPEDYPKYDGQDVIEVSKVADIPMGYDGVMGVPITFLGKWCPEQFEVLDMVCPMLDGKLLFKRILIRFRR